MPVVKFFAGLDFERNNVGEKGGNKCFLMERGGTGDAHGEESGITRRGGERLRFEIKDTAD